MRGQLPISAITLSAIVFGGFVWLTLPARVAVLNDDFGYYRSVIETIQRGRPWTNDWLEPWAASLSTISAVLFRVTGSFTFATHAVLAVAGAASFAATATLFRARNDSVKGGVVLAALLVTVPTVLWKEIEYTSVAIYIPCLLLAMLAAERKQWGRFMLWWSVAFATRQSAIVWAVLPAYELVSHRWTRDPQNRSWFKPGLVLLGGGALFWLLKTSMNRTHAQIMRTEHIGEQIVWRDALSILCIGAFLFVGACGIGRVATQALRGQNQSDFSPWIRSLAAICFGACAVWFVHSSERIGVEHRLFVGSFGQLYGWLLLVVGGFGWWTGGFRVRPDFAAAAFCSGALLAVRGVAWDYYFIDVVLFGLFGVVSTATNVPSRSTESRFSRAPVLLLTAMLAVFHVGFALQLKCDVDRAYGWSVLSEQALREQTLDPAELSYAPFGFTAWYFHSYYIRYDGINSAPDGFGCYLRPGAVEIGQGYSRLLHIFPRFRHDPPADRHNLIAWGKFPYLWFFNAEYYLLRFKTAAESGPTVEFDRRELRISRFPLNDREWRHLVDGTGPWAAAAVQGKREPGGSRGDGPVER